MLWSCKKKNKQSALFLVKGNKNSAGEYLYTHKSIEFNCAFTQQQYQLSLFLITGEKNP